MKRNLQRFKLHSKVSSVDYHSLFLEPSTICFIFLALLFLLSSTDLWHDGRGSLCAVVHVDPVRREPVEFLEVVRCEVTVNLMFVNHPLRQCLLRHLSLVDLLLHSPLHSDKTDTIVTDRQWWASYQVMMGFIADDTSKMGLRRMQEPVI